MFEIRHATYDDADAVVSLWEELILDQLRFDDKFIVSEENRARFKDFVNMRTSHRHCLLAIVDGKAGGYLLFGDDDHPLDIKYKIGMVNDVYVSADCRTRGVGEAMMEKALAQMSEEGYEAARLFVYSRNEAAKALYSKLGFDTEMDVMRKSLD